MAWQNLPSTNTPVNAANLNSLSNSIIEGTWTPVIGALDETNPTVTYTYQIGNYKKIGKIVFFDFYIVAKITALNGTNNYATIEGLPYSSIVPTGQAGMESISVGEVYQALSNTDNVAIDIVGNYLRVQYDYGNNANKWVVTSGNRMIIGGSGFYFTN